MRFVCIKFAWNFTLKDFLGVGGLYLCSYVIIFLFTLLFIFILLNEQKNEARKLTRLKKFKRGMPKAIKFSAELALLKHREIFIAFQ